MADQTIPHMPPCKLSALLKINPDEKQSAKMIKCGKRSILHARLILRTHNQFSVTGRKSLKKFPDIFNMGRCRLIGCRANS